MTPRIFTILLIPVAIICSFSVDAMIQSLAESYSKSGIPLPLPTQWIVNASANSELSLLPGLLALVMGVKEGLLSASARQRIGLWPEAFFVAVMLGYVILAYLPFLKMA